MTGDLEERVRRLELKVELWSGAMERLTAVVRQINKVQMILHARLLEERNEEVKGERL